MAPFFPPTMCVCLGPLGRELTSSTELSDLLGVCVRVHDSSDAYASLPFSFEASYKWEPIAWQSYPSYLRPLFSILD